MVRREPIPDGKMIATAYTIVPSGIGTGDCGTRVYLNWATGPQPKTIILAFAERPDVPGGMNVGMNWLSPTHLELTYKGHRNLDFQAVKCHGIDISVQSSQMGLATLLLSSQFPQTTASQKICSAIPSGRTTGASGGVGGVGSPGGGGELVVNYDTGQVSAFAFGGFQVGWNGGVSGSVYTGFVWGLNGSNSNYSGGFTGVNGGAGLGGFAESSAAG